MVFTRAQNRPKTAHQGGAYSPRVNRHQTDPYRTPQPPQPVSPRSNCTPWAQTAPLFTTSLFTLRTPAPPSGLPSRSRASGPSTSEQERRFIDRRGNPTPGEDIQRMERKYNDTPTTPRASLKLKFTQAAEPSTLPNNTGNVQTKTGNIQTATGNIQTETGNIPSSSIHPPPYNSFSTFERSSPSPSPSPSSRSHNFYNSARAVRTSQSAGSSRTSGSTTNQSVVTGGRVVGGREMAATYDGPVSGPGPGPGLDPRLGPGPGPGLGPCPGQGPGPDLQKIAVSQGWFVPPLPSPNGGIYVKSQVSPTKIRGPVSSKSQTSQKVVGTVDVTTQPKWSDKISTASETGWKTPTRRAQRR
jgi:hypothetical protein